MVEIKKIMIERQITQLDETQAADARKQFARAIVAFSKPFYKFVLVENPGTFPFVVKSMLDTVPSLGVVTNNDLALGRGTKGNGRKVLFEDKIAELPVDQVIRAQRIFDRIIDISTLIPFSLAKRLGPYLQIKLPESKEGLNVLRDIAVRVRSEIPSQFNIDQLGTNLSSFMQALKQVEEELVKRVVANPQLKSEIQELVTFEAQEQLSDMEDRDDQEQIDGLKNEIVQSKISNLKNIKVAEVVDGELREFSQYDTELYKIIEEEKLTEQIPEAREQLGKRIEESKREVVEIIVTRRVVRKVAGLLISDQSLRSLGARVGDITEAEILAATDEEGIALRVKIARELINIPRKKQLRLGLRQTPNFKNIFEVERQKITQAIESGDPFLFAAQLDPKESELIRARIPNIFRTRRSAENKALFGLAKERFQKKMAAETSDNELIELIGQKIVNAFIAKLSQDSIDQAIQDLNIDPEALIDDPLLLFGLSEEILAESEKLLTNKTIPSKLADQRTIKDRKQDDLSTDTVKFIPRVRIKASEELNLAIVSSSKSREQIPLGTVALRTDIMSSEGPFQYFPEYQIKYPEVVIQAIGELYAEYNQAFGPLARANKEWDTDYQFCFDGTKGLPTNYFVQIDMTGLPHGYLQTAANLDPVQVKEDLRNRIFEIENSVAMYQLLMKNFSVNGAPSHFEQRFRKGLEDLRRLHNRPIALLAVTEGKYQLMRESEFGKKEGQSLLDDEVKNLTGFDTFFGPAEFERYVRNNQGNCDFLLYVRSSEPIAKLRDPELPIEQPLLADPEFRKVIKANTVTFNIDDPILPLGSPKRINDTKAYMVSMGMAFPVRSFKDFRSSDLTQFLFSRGVDPGLIHSGEAIVRAKPMQTSYGCYGHLRGSLNDGKFRQRLTHELKRRGPYVIQPEMQSTVIINDTDGKEFAYIDRDFFSFINGVPIFMGGERTLMPINSNEAISGRIHGNETSITAEVT